MDEWSERLDDLLYAGEEIDERVEFGDDEVVVTTHRVIALTPSTDGKRYRALDRPNVTGAATDVDADRGHLKTAASVGVLAALLLAFDLAVDLQGLLGVAPSDAPAAASGALSTVETVLAAIDLLVTLSWAVPALVAVAYVAQYLLGRNQVIRLSVAGEADVLIPVGEDPAVDRIDDALALPDADPVESPDESPAESSVGSAGR
jgi:hypothetical protein